MKVHVCYGEFLTFIVDGKCSKPNMKYGCGCDVLGEELNHNLLAIPDRNNRGHAPLHALLGIHVRGTKPPYMEFMEWTTPLKSLTGKENGGTSGV